LYIISVPVLSASDPDTPARAKLVLTSKENSVEPETEFFCSGKIHGYIRLPERAEGPHLLEGNWILPNGKLEASSRIRVDFPAPGRSTAYIWFGFPERGGLQNSLNPEADAERLQYPGTWRVEVRWDQRMIISSTFTVTCL